MEKKKQHTSLWEFRENTNQNVLKNQDWIWFLLWTVYISQSRSPAGFYNCGINYWYYVLLCSTKWDEHPGEKDTELDRHVLHLEVLMDGHTSFLTA
jgi:hypothetical protein